MTWVYSVHLHSQANLYLRVPLDREQERIGNEEGMDDLPRFSRGSGP
jgi:hypothetical protein